MLSIIIPIYNSAKSLKKCLDGILSQTFADFELILVNDGSTDNSEKICIQYLSDRRVKYISKKNGGVSSARNLGLKNATREWVTFIDSDDYIDVDWLCSFHLNQEYDLIIQGFKVVDNGEIIENILLDEQSFSDTKILKCLDILERTPFTPIRTPWNKFYKRDLIEKNNLRFNNEIHLGEDYIFNNNYLLFCKRVICLQNNSYYYVLSNSGLARRKYKFDENLKIHLEIFSSIKHLSDKHQSYKFYDYYRGKIFKYITSNLLKEDYSYEKKIIYLSKLHKLDNYKWLVMQSRYFYFVICPMLTILFIKYKSHKLFKLYNK